MNHKKIELYNTIITSIFIFGLILNTFLFNDYIPTKIIEYFFWFSLGAYLGFNLLKWEIKKNT
ncbi:hypothetical protein OA88_12370 [Flavobacterium sp. JRM]|nr:hypothetical protein OA88_12370 [Flavobacterium sp. JRM]